MMVFGNKDLPRIATEAIVDVGGISRHASTRCDFVPRRTTDTHHKLALQTRTTDMHPARHAVAAAAGSYRQSKRKNKGRN